ncbi:hypothetical protein GCM10022217_17930 [Chryseobacterium ginsenosidimutans]|uniref:four helix bundle protein n=1 Tax=Chryseobacterium ginsenosidimutans TaxID=687846 RepID=UPI0031D5AD9B
MGNYKELIVWQKSVDLVTEIYSYTKHFPKEEIFSLTEFNNLNQKSEEISKMLNALITRLQTNL